MRSTDVDDLSRIMSAIHPYVGGVVGTSHGDYYIANSDLACVCSAKWQLGMLRALLSDGARCAKQIIVYSEFRDCDR